LSITAEELNNYPERYYGKYVCLPGVAISGGHIERNKDINRFTLGISSARGKYFSGVIFQDLFFSTSDKIGNQLLSELRSLLKNPA
jgi:hypothetical protein